MPKKNYLLVIAVLLVCLSPCWGKEAKVAIASAHPLATAAGFEVLGKGGNVFDAAVAVSAALAVVEPFGSGLGGGGYWLLHRQDGMETVIDGRERAPQAATASMFVDAQGKPDPVLSVDGGKAAAIPGAPAALVHLSEHYGRLPLSVSLAPAIRYAETGFAIGNRYLKLLKIREKALKKSSDAAAVFLSNNQLPKPFSILRQPDLANTLRELAESGRDGFYHGTIAEQLVSSVNQAGGIWTLADLDAYQVIERKPLKGNYQGIEITTVPLSSSGGTVLLETLNILQGYDLARMNTITQKHLISDAMQRAYHDRALFLGDSDFVNVPTETLLSTDYANAIRSSIRLNKTLPSSKLVGVDHSSPQGNNTTHFSIIDNEGNRVSATMSLNNAFGAAFVAKRTGVLLNDEMDDFSSQPGVKNTYGLIGGKANSIAPGKRMLSSMTPTFLETPEKVAVIGTPGGSKIISMVLLAVLDFANGMEPKSMVKTPRFHHQYIPDIIDYEPGAFSKAELQGLAALGHKTKPVAYAYGDMQVVQWQKVSGQLTAASDKRAEGRAVVGP